VDTSYYLIKGVNMIVPNPNNTNDLPLALEIPSRRIQFIDRLSGNNMAHSIEISYFGVVCPYEMINFAQISFLDPVRLCNFFIFRINKVTHLEEILNNIPVYLKSQSLILFNKSFCTPETINVLSARILNYNFRIYLLDTFNFYDILHRDSHVNFDLEPNPVNGIITNNIFTPNPVGLSRLFRNFVDLKSIFFFLNATEEHFHSSTQETEFWIMSHFHHNLLQRFDEPGTFFLNSGLELSTNNNPLGPQPSSRLFNFYEDEFCLEGNLTENGTQVVFDSAIFRQRLPNSYTLERKNEITNRQRIFFNVHNRRTAGNNSLVNAPIASLSLNRKLICSVQSNNVAFIESNNVKVTESVGTISIVALVLIWWFGNSKR